MSTEDTTGLLQRSAGGDGGAREAFARIVYDELRTLAARSMRDERAGHTLQPTAVVNEAFLRMFGGRGVDWQGRTHFLAVGAETVRRVLVDHARRKRARKRGGGAVAVTLGEPLDRRHQDAVESLDLIELDAALHELRALHERHARVVELRFFGGLTNRQIAEVLGVSSATVQTDWNTARAWLRRRLEPRHRTRGGPA